MRPGKSDTEQTQEGGGPCNHGGSDGGATVTNQRTPGIADKLPEERKKQVQILTYQFQKVPGPTNNLILDFQPPV